MPARASPMTGRKEPLVNSSTDEAAAARRSSCLGVNAMRGLRGRLYAWVRSMWKWFAGVEGCTIHMLSWAASCR